MANIIIADDDARVLRATGRLLEAEGHEVTLVPDGGEILKQFSTRQVDLVLTDIYMPEMDGIEVLIKLRRSHPGARIVAMSAGGFRANLSPLQDALLLGAHGVLRKPFQPHELLETVNSALNWTPEGGATHA